MINRFQSSPLEPSLNDDLNARNCDWPGCNDEGLHRAPKSREELNSYHHFCLIHVREYNKGWNYYNGMSDAEVEEDVRKDTVWNRPSWPLGGNPSFEDVNDKIGIFGPDWNNQEKLNKSTTGTKSRGPREIWALSVFDLSDPVNNKNVKSRYKELVKQHHPDKNGGDKAGEEKIKEINEAYQIILEMLG